MDQFDEKQKMFLLFPGFKSRSHQLSKMTNTNNKREKFTNSKYKFCVKTKYQYISDGEWNPSRILAKRQ